MVCLHRTDPRETAFRIGALRRRQSLECRCGPENRGGGARSRGGARPAGPHGDPPACAVRPDRAGLGEPHGIRAVTALLKAGAGLEAEVPMPAEEGDFRATPLWYAVARG